MVGMDITCGAELSNTLGFTSQDGAGGRFASERLSVFSHTSSDDFSVSSSAGRPNPSRNVGFCAGSAKFLRSRENSLSKSSDSLSCTKSNLSMKTMKCVKSVLRWPCRPN